MSTTFTKATTPRVIATAARRSVVGRCSARTKSSDGRSWRRRRPRLPGSRLRKRIAPLNDTIGVAASFTAPFYGISGSCKEIPATAFRGCCGTGPRYRDVDECADAAADRTWVHLQRASRHRQNDDCTHSCDGAELQKCDRHSAAAYG